MAPVSAASSGVPMGAALKNPFFTFWSYLPGPLGCMVRDSSAHQRPERAVPYPPSGNPSSPLTPKLQDPVPRREGQISTPQGRQTGGVTPLSPAANPDLGEVRTFMEYFPLLASSSGTLEMEGKC